MSLGEISGTKKIILCNFLFFLTKNTATLSYCPAGPISLVPFL
jgi:hypothetical protein